MTEQLLTQKAVLERIRHEIDPSLSLNTFHAMMAAGLPKYMLPGRTKPRFEWSDVVAFVASCRGSNPAVQAAKDALFLKMQKGA